MALCLASKKIREEASRKKRKRNGANEPQGRRPETTHFLVRDDYYQTRSSYAKEMNIDNATLDVYKRIFNRAQYRPGDIILVLGASKRHYSRQLPSSWLSGGVDLSQENGRVIPCPKRANKNALVLHRVERMDQIRFQ